MPQVWRPKREILGEAIKEEISKLEVERTKRALPEPTWQPSEEVVVEPTRAWMPTTAYMPPAMPTITEPPVALPTPVKVPPIPKEEPLAVPFWQRALQVFTAPFRWVEETVIKPGLALVATAGGFISEVERRPGEEYWDWKVRSWAEWKPPGIDINVPWSDEPLRLDIRGILELAPWLLIPGAGQVGAGARAARGFAGLAGRLGKVGKVVGYGIEYSPWGMVEKTAGVAMRAGIKAAFKGSEKMSTAIGKKVFGEIVEPPVSPVVKEVSLYFKQAVIPARLKFEEALPKGLRAKQEAVAAKIWAQVEAGKLTHAEAPALIKKALGAVGGIRARYGLTLEKLAKRKADDIVKVQARVASGEITEAGGKALITKINKSPAYIVKQFTKEEMEDLLGMVRKQAETNLERLDLVDALQNTLLGVDLPQPHHIKAFARIFGQEFAEAVGKFGRLPVTTRGQILDLLNLPRAVLASGDLSATFRQGLILLTARPQDVPRAFWRQLKYFASEKLSLQMDDALRARPLHRELVDKMGIEFTVLRKGARLSAKEEPFASNLAQRIPFVRKSERAFTGLLNEMREAAGEAAYNTMTAQGASAAELKLAGQFINIGSGRGTLPANLDKFAPVLNTVLFSARYQASTLQLPRQLGRMFLSKNPYMRKQAAQALVTFVGGGSAILGLLSATGIAKKIEIDPRSGDFGKIIIGETRVDIWRGYLQYTRFMAQMLMGQRKTAYGNMNRVERFEIASRFLQSKLSPAAGLMLDLLKGETYMGEDLITSTKDVVRSARERMLPLAIQDVIDAVEMSGVNGLWTAAPATLGIGILTYVNDFVRVKERIAGQLGYETWDKIDPATQRRLENSNPELQAAMIEFDRQIMGIAWGDWRLAGKAIENVFTENVNKAVAQYRETKDGVQFAKKVRDAWIARRGGYAARQEMPQFEDIVRRMKIEDTAEALVSLGPEQLAIRLYNEALFGDDMYDEFGDFKYDEALRRKEQLRVELGNEMFEYVEMYRDIKYEALPPEFQELMRAKEVMRPYWQVRDEAIRIFGEPKTPWAQRRLDQFITRTRKRLRAMNPQMAYYYELFYSR